MQAQIMFFSHVKKTAVSIPSGPAGGKKLAEVLALQRKQTATSGRPAQ